MEMLFPKFMPVVRRHCTKPHVELEFRIGKLNRGRFDTNVGKATFEKALRALNKYKGWESVSSKEETIYYGLNGRRAVCNAETGDVKRVIKTRVEVTDHELEDQPFDVRLGVSTEVPYEPEEEDEVFEETKTRKRYSFTRKNLVIDVSAIQGNPEDPDCDDDMSYQIELEIIDPTQVGDDNILFNIMHKVFDVLKIT
ncbi:hypothetical protein EBT31_03835 [bacterium]|nr:hypothetical protein [bacterium]NBX48753.1 hypothetical protein [bacterium]